MGHRRAVRAGKRAKVIIKGVVFFDYQDDVVYRPLVRHALLLSGPVVFHFTMRHCSSRATQPTGPWPSHSLRSDILRWTWCSYRTLGSVDGV